MQLAIHGIQMIIWAIYVLFLPGLALSFVFFARETIDLIERVALSFALSIAVVPLLVFYLNLAHVRISLRLVALEVLAVILVSLFTALLIGRLKKGSHEAKKRR